MFLPNWPNFRPKIFHKPLFFIIFVAMETHTKAVILHSVKYADNKMVVDTFTETHGRVSFAVTVAKSSRGRMKKQLFQPLSILEVVFDFRPNKALQRLTDVRMAQPLALMMTDPYKLSVALFVAEFLTYATISEQQNETLFKYIVYSVEWLDSAQGSIANFHVVFMLKLAQFLGFSPNMDTFGDGAYFDLREGVFSPTRPMHPDVVEPAEAEVISTLMRLNYTNMGHMSLSRNQRNRCLDLILSYYRLHVASFPDLKSLDILRELFV